MRVRWSFLRHGESVANAAGRIAGHQDSPLTARGRVQARDVADALLDVPFERVLTSDLCRASETARLAAPGHAAHIDAGLRERSMGDWEGRPRAELRQLGFEDAVLSVSGRPPGGESHHQLLVRALEALSRLDAPVDTLVVAHGGLLRAVLGAVDAVAPEVAVRIRFPNVGLQTRALPVGTWGRLLATVRSES